MIDYGCTDILNFTLMGSNLLGFQHISDSHSLLHLMLAGLAV